MSPAYDDNGKLAHPSVGFDNYGFGYDMFKWCIDYAKANWADATPENTGVCSSATLLFRFSSCVTPALRMPGKTPAILMPTTSSSWCHRRYDHTNRLQPRCHHQAANPQIKYWIGCGFFDDYSVGIARAAADAGKADQTVCSTAGGSTLINQWDAERKLLEVRNFQRSETLR